MGSSVGASAPAVNWDSPESKTCGLGHMPANLSPVLEDTTGQLYLWSSLNQPTDVESFQDEVHGDELHLEMKLVENQCMADSCKPQGCTGSDKLRAHWVH